MPPNCQTGFIFADAREYCDRDCQGLSKEDLINCYDKSLNNIREYNRFENWLAFNGILFWPFVIIQALTVGLSYFYFLNKKIYSKHPYSLFAFELLFCAQANITDVTGSILVSETYF